MKRLQYILLCGLLLLVAACEKDTLPMNFSPALTTGAASDIFRVGATLSGSIQKTDGVVVKDCGILISELQSMAEYTEIKTTSTENTFEVLAQNLEPGKKYYYCAYASSGYSIARGEIKEFSTTDSNAPVFSELAVENKDEKSFTVATTILDEGGSDLALCGFCWSAAENSDGEPTTGDNVSNVPLGTTAISVRIKDLTPNKEYLVRAYGVNAKGIGYGKTITVLTNNATAPVVSSITPTDSTALSVSVKASLLSAGESTVTEIGFCWSAEKQEPTTANMKYDATGQMGNAEFDTQIGGLKAETTYYIRAYAINAQGTGYGDIYTFTTKKGLTVTTLKAEANSVNIKAYGQVTPGTQVSHHGFEAAPSMDELLNRTGNMISVDVHTNMSYNETDGTFNGDIAGLIADTHYYIRAWFLDTATQETVFGNVLEVTTGVPGIFSLQDLIAYRDAKRAGESTIGWTVNGIVNIYADIDLSFIGNWEPITAISEGEILEGNGHTISGLKMTCSSNGYYGFIYCNYGAIRNLRLGTGSVQVETTETASRVGALCGLNYGIINDCSSEVAVESKQGDNDDSNGGVYITGICGCNESSGRIISCINRGNITGGWQASGVVGENNGSVERCVNYGTISALNDNQAAEGISGCGHGAQMFNCINYGIINGGTAPFVGGVSAGVYGKVEGCTNEGTVSGSGLSVGGISGDLYEGGILQTCQNKGVVTGGENTFSGGIVGCIRKMCTYGGNTSNGTVNGTVGNDTNAIGQDFRNAPADIPSIDDLPTHKW